MKTVTRRIVELLLSTPKNNAEIARMVGRHRDTIRRYRSNLALTDLTKTETDQMGDAEIEQIIKGKKKRQSKFAEVDFNDVVRELKKPGKTAGQVYNEYVESVECASDDGRKPMSLTRFYGQLREFRKQRSPEFRHDHVPARSMQFDFSGKRPFYIDQNGQKVSVELAVAVLPYSVLTFACVVRTQSLPDSIEAFVRSLEYFGGAPTAAVFDNFKAVVTVPRRGSKPAILNQNFLAAIDHYSVFPEPARGFEPRDKGIGENAVQQTQRIFLGQERHIHCRSLTELNERLLAAVNDLNNRPMKSHGGMSRRELFEKYERSELQPLPDSRYEFGEWRTNITVPAHYHIATGATAYSVPNRLVGSKVNIKTTASIVEFYADGRPVAIHKRVFDGRPRVTDVTHMPPNHRAMRSYRQEDVLKEARRLGPTVAGFVEKHIETHKNVKAAGDMTKNIARKMHQCGRDLVERAIVQAEERGQISAEAVYRILERGIPDFSRGTLAKPASPSGNVRGPDYYSDGEAS